MIRGGAVTLLKDRDVVRQAIAHALADELRREDERDDSVRRRLAAMKQCPAVGSPAWEDLFHRLLEEEYVREGIES